MQQLRANYIAWWAALQHDLDQARDLTYNPPAWGDYQWAISHLAERSLASKFIYAVHDPERVAFMRFVPQVAAGSRVFEAFLTPMTFLSLVRLDDGTRRVWGSGRQFARPEISSAVQLLRFDRIR
jgi:hypothetical protein